MNLSFISPIYLLGLLGIAVPVLIHLLTRRQQTRVRFSAVYLLLQSQKRSIKKAAPNRLLLLLIRCLGIILLSLALANPRFSFDSQDAGAASKSSANVFVLDDSFSMSTRSGDTTRYALAVESLLHLIDRLHGDSRTSLVLASSPARVLLDWTQDRATFGKILKTSTPSFRTTSIGPAMSLAKDLLRSADRKAKRIFLLTDGERDGWDEKDFPEKGLNLSFPVTVIDFSGKEAETNRAAVSKVEVFQEFLTHSRIIRVKVDIVNFSTQKALQRFPVSLWVNGEKKSEEFVDVPPQSTAHKEFSFPYLKNELISGVVRIGDDALMRDNRRHFTFQPDRNIQVLLVDGDPKTVGHQSETFYLENALNPFSTALSNIVSTISTLEELPARDLFDYSVVILCNVRELPFEYNRQLEKFVLRGGALFVSMGDQVDPKYYNEKLGNLIPVKIESLHQVGARDEPFRLNLESTEHPVMKIFKGKFRKEMQETRFTALYKVNPIEGRNFKIPLWFMNQYPALIESEVGKGRVLFYVSTLDRDWNNFPIQPTFLPWIQRWIKYAARGLDSIMRQNLLVGEPFSRKGGPDEDRAFVQTPGGTVHLLEMNNDSQIFEDTYRPGVYRIFHESVTQRVNAKTPAATSAAPLTLPVNAVDAGTFTVNVDIRESSPEKISEEEIRDLFGKTPVGFSSGRDFGLVPESSTGFPLTTPLLLLVAGMMLWEGWTVRRE